MSLRKKIWLGVSIFALANLAFIAGQYFYYSQKQDLSPIVSPSSDSFTAKLLNFISHEVILSLKNTNFEIGPDEMSEWVENYDRSYYNEPSIRLSEEKILGFLENLNEEITIAPVDAKFKLENDVIVEFIPPKNGQALNIAESYKNIVDAISNTTANMQDTIRISLIVDEIAPEISLSNINDLGINALLGHGESDFMGSSNSRAHNINVSSKIFNGILLKPGEEFSFNTLLGEVDGTTGYLPELVIKSGQLIPEYGGGVCQVSTTVF
ncbi:MAG: VanW family protein, partial [Candidatus Paceibacterota bacterium]